MGAVIARYLGPASALPVGMYTRQVDRHGIGAVVALVSCRRCGGLTEVNERYTVDSAGRVVPALACDTANCPERGWVTLEAFAEEVL